MVEYVSEVCNAMRVCPRNYKIVSGVGKSQFPLVAFDNALRDAGIGDYNLVKVSSVLPANCVYREIIPEKKGSIIYAAYSVLTLENGEAGMTAVAVAVPTITQESGIIFESSLTNAKQNLEEHTRQMCVEAMENRGKLILEIKSTSNKVEGEPNCFISAVSAVVMW